MEQPSNLGTERVGGTLRRSPEIMELKAKIKELEDQHKQAYKMDQKGNKMVSEHGEIISPARFTPGSEVIAVKLKK